jgi:hypothetical protein
VAGRLHHVKDLLIVGIKAHPITPSSIRDLSLCEPLWGSAS